MKTVDRATHERFTKIRRKASGAGRELHHVELTWCADLALELGEAEPDEGKVEDLAGRLGIAAGELAEVK